MVVPVVRAAAEQDRAWGTVDPAELDFEDGIPHIWHAELQLRRAIKKIVADMGHEDVLLDPFERIARRFGEDGG
ncbi:MAG: hypothetical protein M3540_00490 [Actinomycetota bacterium]|nr:hypothetical protein [Actinomycetota bacterium]